MKPIIFNCLDKLVVEKDRLSTCKSKDCWRTVSYETGEVQGTLLTAGVDAFPQDITLRLDLTGWHKIYVCLINLSADNTVMLKLSNDPAFCRFRSPFKGAKHHWQRYEMVDEFLWKCADLTEQDIILAKVPGMQPHVSSLVWLKCVPMSDEEVAQHKAYHNTKATRCVHGHVDPDSRGQLYTTQVDKHLCKEWPLCETDIGELSMEISMDYDTRYDADTSGMPITADDSSGYEKGLIIFRECRDEVFRSRIKLLHEHGISVYATNRMEVASFQFPVENAFFALRFSEENPQYYTVMRDGSTVKVCSYAYPEVQDYVIGNLLHFLKNYDFDGLTLLFHRGLHVAFEEPVVRRFKELYPDVDPFTLPTSDDRLNGVWRNIMTEFMRKLRKAATAEISRPVKINVVVDYHPQSCFRFGLDTEQWAKEGLIDSILQGNMSVTERLDGCLKEDGTIDLQLYKKRLKEDYVITRYMLGNHTEEAIEGFIPYKERCEKYGVKCYIAFNWEHRTDPKDFPEIIQKMKEAGAENFFMFNMNHAMDDMPEFHSFCMAGHDIIDPETYQVNRYRVLSLDGSNISAFNPNWRG